MRGKEELERPFQYDLVLFSEEQKLSYKRIIRQNVTVLVDKGNDGPRAIP